MVSSPEKKLGINVPKYEMLNLHISSNVCKLNSYTVNYQGDAMQNEKVVHTKSMTFIRTCL